MEDNKMPVYESIELGLGDKQQLFETQISQLKAMYAMGKIPKLDTVERSILEFCHNTDMKEFLREEFRRHPIELDEFGGLKNPNPFINERRPAYCTIDPTRTMNIVPLGSGFVMPPLGQEGQKSKVDDLGIY